MASNCVILSAEEESENAEQREIELEMLQSIFTHKELTILKDKSEYLVKIEPKLSSDVHISLLDGEDSTCDGSANKSRSVTVTHLPEVTLYINCPPDYPSRSPPTFHLSSCWFDPKFSDGVNERLLQCFSAGLPVVYDWTLFIQDELVEVYSQQQQQEIKHYSSVGKSQDQKRMKQEVDSTDGAMVQSPTRDLVQIFLRNQSLLSDIEEFDCYQKHREFQMAEHECDICYMTLLGSAMCRPCELCGLMYCKECLMGYCQMCIDEGQITQLTCPKQGCSADLTDIFLKSVLPEDLYKRLIKLKDAANLDAIPGVVFCPRRDCASRIFSDPDSNLVQCDKCGFPFCKLCKQTWHGPGTCPSIEKLKALGLADLSEPKTKSEVAERRRIEELQSILWLRSHDNVKVCPTCETSIQKSGGCNHMACRHCGSHFCWLCGELILGYGHFSDDGCPLFRDEDYLPPQDLEPSEVTAPDDIKVLEETLFSACPRCAKSKTKVTTNNWIRCRYCQFEYCYLCHQPCYGLWHFDEEYGCKRRTTTTEDLAYATEGTLS